MLAMRLAILQNREIVKKRINTFLYLVFPWLNTKAISTILITGAIIRTIERLDIVDIVFYYLLVYN
jgi:hypothetical protein